MQINGVALSKADLLLAKMEKAKSPINGPYVKVKDASDWNPAPGNDQLESDDDDSDSSELSSEEGEQ